MSYNKIFNVSSQNRNAGAPMVPVHNQIWNQLVTGQNQISADTIGSVDGGPIEMIDGIGSVATFSVLWEAKQQQTSASTAIPFIKENFVNKFATVDLSTAAGASEIFEVSHPLVKANSLVSMYIVNYDGTYVTNGLPQLYWQVSAGKTTVTIYNAHSANALLGKVYVGFMILNLPE